MGPAASGGRTVEPGTEEDWRASRLVGQPSVTRQAGARASPGVYIV